MSKYEFVISLQRHLTGKVSVQKLNELTDYYRDYIDTEIRKGKSEEEVLASLGDPRLLAKSIAETEGGAGEENEDYHEEHASFGQGSTDQNAYGDADTRFVVNGKVIPKWKGRLIALAVFIILMLILFLVLRVLGFALGIFFRYVLPVLIPLAVIWFIIDIFARK